MSGCMTLITEFKKLISTTKLLEEKEFEELYSTYKILDKFKLMKRCLI